MLELERQFAKLDSRYIRGDSPSQEAAGWWHASCLAPSDIGSAWREARRRNFRDVRRHVVLAEYPDWIVLRDPNRGKIVAISRHGELLSLSRGDRKTARSVAGGRIYKTIDEGFHLEIDDTSLVQTMQQNLLLAGRCSLAAVLEEIGITDRVVHAEALEGGAFVYDGALQRDWDPRFVAAERRRYQDAITSIRARMLAMTKGDDPLHLHLPLPIEHYERQVRDRMFPDLELRPVQNRAVSGDR